MFFDNADQIAALQRRVAQLERVVETLAAQAGVDVTGLIEPGPSEQVKALKQQGKEIAAIKLYRQESGASLREAKEAVERL